MQIDFDKQAKVFKALGDEIRLKILDYLLDKTECNCICHISKILKRDQSVIYRHLKILEAAGIVKTRKDKNSLMCCVSDKKKLKKILEGLK